MRLFAGDYGTEIVGAADAVALACTHGQPMGSVLKAQAESPLLFAMAARDPRSEPLQRMQIIKVWNEDGKPQEAVLDIACSGGDLPDQATHRCPDNGSSVDVASCETRAGTGAATLEARWQDPTFKPAPPSAYYLRVLENPSCRWSTWDAIRNGSPPNPELPLTLQERAWSSPIWLGKMRVIRWFALNQERQWG